MLLSRFEERWPLPTESLPELPKTLTIVTLTLTPCPIISGVLTSLLLPHLSSPLTNSAESTEGLFCCFEKIIEATLYKTVVVQPLTSNLATHLNKMSKTWWAILEGYSPRDSYTVTPTHTHTPIYIYNPVLISSEIIFANCLLLFIYWFGLIWFDLMIYQHLKVT